MSANTYDITVFDPVSSGTVVSASISDGGEIVGTFIDNTNQVTHGYISSGGVVSIVALTGATQTDVTAVNNGGTVVGFTFSGTPGVSDAVGFVASGGAITSFSLTGQDVEPVAVNSAGEVVGNTDTGGFIYVAGSLVPFSVSGAQATTVSGVNNAGVVFGNYIDSAGVQHGFETSTSGTVTIDPAGSLTTTVAGVTPGGEVVGTYSDSSGNTYGFTDTGGTFTRLQAFQSTFTVATGVDSGGTVVGYDLDASGNQHGFVDLGGVIDQFDPAGSVSTMPTAISNSGEIVGTFDNAGGTEQGFAATVTPSYNVATIDPGVLGGVQNVALNNGGEIVGTYADAAGTLHGFTDIAGTITTFNDTSTSSGATVQNATTVTAVNDSGTFTGFSSAGNAASGQFFVDQGGTVTDEPGGQQGILPVAINASGLVVGNAGSSGFVDSGGVATLINVTGAQGTTVTAVNNAGEIVGDYIDAAGVQHGFADVAGFITNVDPATSLSTAVNGINARGDVVGTYTDGTNTYGFTDIAGFIQPVSLPGSTFTVLNAINDADTAVGYATISGVNHAIVDDGGVVSVIYPPNASNAQATAINDAGTVIGTYADLNGVEHAFAANTTPACYCPGTRIRTPSGEVPVETLDIGDTVLTVDGTAEPVRWIGRRSYAARFLRGRPSLLPVRIEAGALADGIPSQDLLVSPAHALLLDGVLAKAGDLVNGTTIVRETGLEVVEYIHIELAHHDLVWANGAAAETFVDDDSRAIFGNAAEYAALYGHQPPADPVFCAERVSDGYALDAIRAKLHARARVTRAA